MPDIEPVPVEYDTRQGLTIRGDGWGDPTHPHVFLAHGGGQTRHSWGGTAEALADRGWYAVAYDQRGHGDSDWSDPGDYDIVRYGEDLADIVATCDEPPVVVGASLGGLAGLLVEGNLAPGSLAALVLVDITPRQEAVGVERILEFMTAQAIEGFGSLEEVADAIAAYQPHRQRPANVDGLRKNLRLGEDGSTPATR
jgi:pimeloyl-ACP methyl ester carboxylesterase